MKKILSLITAVALLFSVTGCTTNNESETKQSQNDKSETKETVSIEIKFGKESEGKTLMDEVKSVANVKEENGFITGIDNLVANPDKKEFIAIYINGEMAQVGADSLILKNGDKVEFKLEKWEWTYEDKHKDINFNGYANSLIGC